MNRFPFLGLLYDCVIAADMREASAYCPRMLGTEPAHCMLLYRNKRFFPIADFPDPKDNDIPLAFLNMPFATTAMKIRENDKAEKQAAASILDRGTYCYSLDNYGLQGECEQSHTGSGK